MRDLSIAGHLISDDSPAFVVAEIGSNHCGSVILARQLIEAAASAGVDAVKLQKRDLATFLTPEQHEAPYENENSYGRTYGEHRAALELTAEQHWALRDYAHELGLIYGCTAFDKSSLTQLVTIVGVDFVKIASGCIDLDHHDLLFSAHRWGQGVNKTPPVILSTGGATMEDIVRAQGCMAQGAGAPHALLQCTSLYPCPPERLNLRAITTLREAFPETVIGFSDHQHGIDMAVAAYVLGARIFEKHVTLDHTARGTDHAMSLEPAALTQYVRSLRRIPDALGDGVKRLLPEEIPALRKQGRRDFGDH